MAIEKQDFDFLKELGQKMVTQDKRATSYPLFMVYDEEKIYSENGSETERIREDEEWLCVNCTELSDKGEPLPDDCSFCEKECFAFFNWELRPQPDHGVFFTAEACEEYIKSRHYEFNKPCSYAISMYWSNEMKRVMEILCELGERGGSLTLK